MKEKEIELDAVICREQESLFRYACYRIGNTDDASDILQDVFLKAYSKPLLFISANNIPGYLYRSVANACISYHRQHAKNLFVPIDEAKGITEEKDEDFRQEFIRINRILSTIPEEQTEVIRLRIICGKSFVDIAKILSLPVTTVKSRFKYGIEKLRNDFFK